MLARPWRDAADAGSVAMSMSKAELESKHLAELHELAADAGVPRYRLLRYDELIEELLVRSAAPREDGEEEKEARPERAPRRRRRRRTREPEGEGASQATAERPREAAGPERGGEEDREEEVAAAEEETEPVSGVLDVQPQGHGFVRLGGLEPAEGDVYVSASQIRRCELRAGDEVSGPARRPRRGERHPALIRVDAVNGADPADQRSGTFEALTPIAPRRRLVLEPAPGDVLVRAAELLAPPAYGQRVLIRAAPRSGRTTLLRGLVRAIAAAPGDQHLVVLLVDERPEEVTEWRRQAPGVEIAAAPADLAAPEQVRHAELALARAKRRAEAGEDVVFVIDSLTRLAVASGDPAAVKPFFGAGRELEEEGAGSLTVIATVLAGTPDGDEVIEAVETTENATIALDHSLAAAGVVPAIDISRSSVAGESGLLEGSELAAIRRLSAELRVLDPTEAAGLLRERIEASASNPELLQSL